METANMYFFRCYLFHLSLWPAHNLILATGFWSTQKRTRKGHHSWHTHSSYTGGNSYTFPGKSRLPSYVVPYGVGTGPFGWLADFKKEIYRLFPVNMPRLRSCTCSSMKWLMVIIRGYLIVYHVYFVWFSVKKPNLLQETSWVTTESENSGSTSFSWMATKRSRH